MAPKNNGGNNGGMVAQEHGGALKSGGTSGNRGGSGRPPSAIREHCRGSFAQRVAILEAIADGEPLPMTKIDGDEEITIQVSAAIRERTQAIDMLGKYGGVDKLALTTDEQPEDEMTPERRLAIWEGIKCPARRHMETPQALERRTQEGQLDGPTLLLRASP